MISVLLTSLLTLNRANQYFGIFLIGIASFSCQKIVRVKLADAQKKFVVEANISNQPGDCLVSIIQTKGFSENNDFPGVSGAIVVITDGDSTFPCTELSPGNYSCTGINGTPGHLYTLNVQVAGQHFTAQCTLPVPVTLDSISIEDRIVFGDSTKTIHAHYSDPATKGNAYHFIEYKNNKRLKPVFVANDDYTNGNTVSTQLMTYDNSTDEDKLHRGDTVTVTMECVDRSIYLYWFSINAATGQSDSATPSNPVSNIIGGALGYFSAHTTQTGMLVVR